jgi:NADH-quinone oxidoreductase subunit H
MSLVGLMTLVERRLLAFIQGRLGPNRVGFGGILQPIADLVKSLFKEKVLPREASKTIFLFAPTIFVTLAFLPLVVYPFGPVVTIPFTDISFPLYVTRFDISLIYVLAITSVAVYGIALAGWSSGNKYSLMGGLRSSAQMISFALGMSVVGVILMSGSLDLVKITEQQSGWGGMRWNIFFQPLGFIIYLISGFAETNRIPFDLPEAETELVAGYHTEYGALHFAIFMMGEYLNMFTVSMLATVLFLGGYNGPGVSSFPWLGLVYFVAKAGFFIFLYMWVRGTLPRLRFDQLMDFGWKLLLPLAIINVVISATLSLLGWI